MRGRSKSGGIRIWHWLLPVVIGFVIVIATSMPFAGAGTAQHLGQESSLHLSMNAPVSLSDHGMADHKSSIDHKVHSACGPGAGCFTLTFEEMSATIAVSTGHTVNVAPTVILFTRSIAPPLPPPIPFIIA